MAYNRYLIRFGSKNGQELPMRFMKAASYVAEPNNRQESENIQAITGLTRRVVMEHTKTQIEFDTPRLTNAELAELNRLLEANMSDTHKRDITLNYYSMETDSYRTSKFYMPVPKYPIRRVSGATVFYNPVHITFIEY